MSYVIPDVGSRGLITLASPFDSDVINTVEYTVDSVRSMRDLINSGSDPYTEYYAPKGITKDLYDAAVETNTVIVAFRSDNGTTINVPAQYITTYPDGNVEKYHILIASVKLGAIHDGEDLNPLLNLFTAMTQAELGLTPAINLVSIDTRAVTEYSHEYNQNQRLEVKRMALNAINDTDANNYFISNPTLTPLQYVNQLIAQIATLTSENNLLKDKVLALSTRP